MLRRETDKRSMTGRGSYGKQSRLTGITFNARSFLRNIAFIYYW
jgi:hypothetical protein